MRTLRPSGEWAPSIPYTARAFRPYVAALGQLTLAWNDLHLALQMLFCTVMGGGFVSPYLAIWNAIKSDRTQRDVLSAAAAAKAMNGGSQRLADEIKWICDRADSLEEARNNALHSPLWGTQGSTPTQVGPVTGLGHIRANKLAGKDLLSEFRWCRDGATTLCDYATTLDFAFCRGKPLPIRPTLPARRPTKRPRKNS